MDEYLAGLDEEQRIQLERIRRIVKETVSDVEEASSYGMPAFKYRGRPVLGFTARKNHLSIQPFSPDAVEAVRDKLGAYDISKGTIRFTEDLPIPADILKQVVNARLQEIGWFNKTFAIERDAGELRLHRRAGAKRRRVQTRTVSTSDRRKGGRPPGSVAFR